VARALRIATSPRCSICKAETRDKIDAWLARRGDVDPVTNSRVTWEFLLDGPIRHLLGGETVSKTSVRRHLGMTSETRAHTRIVQDGEEADELEEALTAPVETGDLLDEIDKLLEEDTVSPTAILAVQLRAWALSIRKKVALGEEVTLTSDQAARAAAVLLKSESQAAERSLLGALAQATGAAFEEAMALNRSGRALPRGMPEIVDYEVVEDAEVAEVVSPAPSPAPPPPPPPAPPAPSPVVVEDDEPMTMRERRPGGYREKVDSV
jgi:hypothetical protein